MQSFIHYAEEAFMGKMPPTAAPPVYMALATGPITADSTGASMPEVANAHGYARVEVQGTEVTFPAATGPWGTITDVALVDSPLHGMGTILAYASVPETLTPPGARPLMRVETFAAIAKAIWLILQSGSRGHQRPRDTP